MESLYAPSYTFFWEDSAMSHWTLTNHHWLKRDQLKCCVIELRVLTQCPFFWLVIISRYPNKYSCFFFLLDIVVVHNGRHFRWLWQLWGLLARHFTASLLVLVGLLVLPWLVCGCRKVEPCGSSRMVLNWALCEGLSHIGLFPAFSHHILYHGPLRTAVNFSHLMLDILCCCSFNVIPATLICFNCS